MSVRSARGALLSQGFLPTDWYVRWESAGMTLGTGTQVLPDASGNARNGAAANYNVVDAVIGPNRVITNPSGFSTPVLTVPSHATWRTVVWVAKAAASESELLRTAGTIAGGATTGWSIYSSGRVKVPVQSTEFAATTPIAANTLVVVVARSRTQNGAAEIEIRANSTVIHSRTATPGGDVLVNQILVSPRGTASNNLALLGMFDRRLTDDETVAVEADLRSRYGF